MKRTAAIAASGIAVVVLLAAGGIAWLKEKRLAEAGLSQPRATALATPSPSAPADGASSLALRVVAKAAPSGYRLWGRGPGGNGTEADVWVEDMDGNGVRDMAFLLVPDASVIEFGRGARTHTTEDLLMVVEPVGEDGSSRELARVSGREFANLLPEPWRETYDLSPIIGTSDFDRDGDREVRMWAGYNAPIDIAVRFDYAGHRAVQFLVHDREGTVRPVDLGYHAGFEGAEYYFFRNVDLAGPDEYIRVFLDRTPEGYANVTSLEVHAWNGDSFEYSSELSHRLAQNFDPAADLPAN